MPCVIHINLLSFDSENSARWSSFLSMLLVMTISEVHPAVGVAAVLPWSACLQISDPQELQALSCLDSIATEESLKHELCGLEQLPGSAELLS